MGCQCPLGVKGLNVEENNIDIHKLIKVPDDLSKQ